MNKFQIYIGVLIALIHTSCRDFLKESPKSNVSDQQFYNTPDDAKTAVTAAYFFFSGGGSASAPNGSTQSTYQSLLNVGMDLATDDLQPGPGATNPDVRSLSVHNHSSSNRTFYENWQQHYAGIRKANVVIEKVPLISFGKDTLTQKRYIAEAKFIRAWIYFNLVRLWGDVPLVLEPKNATSVSDYYIAKSPKEQVYLQIETDLKEASKYLSSSYAGADIGRATKGAALALLSKVYLTKASWPLNLQNHYQDALDYAKQVLSPPFGTGTYNYALRPNYQEVFLPAFKNNNEHIFSAQRLSNFQGQGNNDFARQLPNGLVPGINGGLYADQVRFWSETVDPTNPVASKRVDKQFSIYKLYTPGDKRRNNGSFATRFRGNTSATASNWYVSTVSNPSFPRNGVQADSIPYLNKYWDPNSLSIATESAANTPLLRYSEILLIAAEAENELNGPGGAYQYINAVRSRAGLAPLSGLSKESFRQAVYLERRLEFVFEYQRWFDLIREKDDAGQPIFTNALQKVGITAAQPRNALFPIPQTELDNNPYLTQNPGW